MSRLANKRILVGITGGIAAYKVPGLVRMLRQEGADVQVVMTPSAKSFVTPLALATFSKNTVHEDMFAEQNEPCIKHIDLARWADIVLIVPATANFIAKFVHGFADNLLTAICLATASPIFIAPAMNHQMWRNFRTQHNVEILKESNVVLLGPASGEQACGEYGEGCLIDFQMIMDRLASNFHTEALAGKKVLITAGPTWEAVDPVRYLGNYSSGKMGFALAEAAVEAGASVTLVSGPVALHTPAFVRRLDVISAQQMFETVMSVVAETDIFISAAAVADYRHVEILSEKIKREKEELTLRLIRNPDIVGEVAKLSHRPFIVGFAAESENLVENALNKLRTKHMDMIVANLINRPDRGFGSDNNELTILSEDQSVEMPLMSKSQLAHELIQLIASRYLKDEKNTA